MKNYAGKDDKDEEIAEELRLAGISLVKLPEFMRDKNEVKTVIMGELYKWGFRRAWYYWVADGPGLPLEEAMELHEKWGNVVRVDGHCCCPSPLEWNEGFATGLYHVDSQEGLNALADMIRRIHAKGLLLLGGNKNG
jgi:hypothetical protein